MVPLICLVKPLSMLIFQRAIGGLILGRLLHLLPGEPPGSNFLVRISIVTTISAYLFSIAYLAIADTMPIDDPQNVRNLLDCLFILVNIFLPHSRESIGAVGDVVIMSINQQGAIFDFFHI